MKETEARAGPAEAAPGSLDSLNSLARIELSAGALYGLAGDVVRTLMPHTEADPAALLLTYLAMFGNACGSQPSLKVGADSHPGRLFVMIVGDSARGRKGTAGNEISRLLAYAEPKWYGERIERGIQSPEAVVARAGEGRDHRLMLIEGEMGRLLIANAHRPGLFSVLKEAYDGSPLSVMTKNSRNRASAPNAHVSVIGHITGHELAERYTSTDLQAGFAPRFLYVVAKRSQLLPRGGDLPEETIDHLAERISGAVTFAREYALSKLTPINREVCAYHGVYPDMPLERTEAFWDLWDKLYVGEFEQRPPGVAGAVTSRVAAQVLRLSVLFALGDLSGEVDVRHLEAAMAVWRYCEASAVAIFGTMTGNRDADRVLRALQDGQLSRTDISVLFQRHKSKAQLDVILEAVMATGLVRTFREGGDGRTRDIYELLEPPAAPKRERSEPHDENR